MGGNVIEQEIIKMPDLETHISLMGRKTSRLPINKSLIVQGRREKPYPVKLTNKTKYSWKELTFNPDAKFTAIINTETVPWTVKSIVMVGD